MLQMKKLLIYFTCFLCLVGCQKNDIQVHNGENTSLNKLDGSWVVINYWADWCPPCLKEMPELVKFSNQNNPLEKIKNLNLKINSLNILSNTRIKNLLAKNRINLEKVDENLQILNPLAILKRGYSIIHNKDGNVIKSNAQININEELTARFGEGNAVIKVKKIND